MPGRPIGEYRYRVTILPRSLTAKNASGQRVESWPESGAVTRWAKVEAPSGSERIADGILGHTGTARVRFRGPASVAAVDRVRVETTGAVYTVVGVWVEEFDTVCSLSEANAGA